jgi:hypothetical protein
MGEIPRSDCQECSTLPAAATSPAMAVILDASSSEGRWPKGMVVSDLAPSPAVLIVQVDEASGTKYASSGTEHAFINTG